MWYTIVSAIIIGIEALLIGIFIYSAAKKKEIISKGTRWYFLPVFFMVYVLYLIGYISTKKPITATTLLRLFACSLETFVFKVDLSFVEPLAITNVVYQIAMAIGTLLAGFTLISSALSFFSVKLKNKISIRKYIKANEELIIGCSEMSLKYARDNKAIIVAQMGDDKYKDLMRRGYVVLRKDFSNNKKSANLGEYLKKKLKKDVTYHFLAFNDQEINYALLIDQFAKTFKEFTGSKFVLHIEASLVELDVINRKFIDANKCKNLCIKCFNKYELLSRKFIIDHPISKYLPEDFYGEYRTIKPDKKINVLLLGYGKVNYELMKLMVIQNQFVGIKDGKFVNHPVNYYAFDSEESRLSSDMMLRMQYDYDVIQTNYPSAPEPMCNCIETTPFDIRSIKAIENISYIMNDDNAFSYIVVSIGSDFENISFAERLYDMFGDYNTIKIFARVKGNTDKEIKGNKDNHNIVCFGCEREIVTRDVIINDSLDKVSKEVNKIYDEKSKNEFKEYNERPTIEMYSNTYNALSIFFKIGLLGMEFVKEEDVLDKTKALTKEQLFKSYEGYFGEEGSSDKYKTLSVWNMLGFSEHSRWVAQYMLEGFKPMDYKDITLEEVVVNKTTGKKDIKIINKNIDKREHCCLTNYYALDNYHQYALDLCHKQGYTDKTMKDIDTYKYDYMFLENSFDNMIESGYLLVNKE